MHTGERWRLGHRPALDGLRGIAVLLVLAGHATLLPQRFAEVGVSVFFVLSGFLITALLLEEHAGSRRIRLGAFYARRARRLMPALVAMLVIVAVGFPLLGIPLRAADVIAALFYFANWWQIEFGMGAGPLVHTWSLSVEEQFYIVWPVALLLLARRGRGAVIAACLLGVGASVAADVMLHAGGASQLRLLYGTDVAAKLLLAGALVAALLVGRRAPAWELPVSWLAAGWLRYVGRRSYALYLWHMPLLVVAAHFWGTRPLPTAAMLVATFVAAEASWRLVESPARRLLVAADTPAAGPVAGRGPAATPVDRVLADRVEPSTSGRDHG